jgi:hypothetical protein
MSIPRHHMYLMMGVVVLLLPTWTTAQPRTDEIVARAARYMETFVERFSAVVAEEHYVQETAVPHHRRELRSDFLLVKPQGSANWIQFRDVFEVDGRPVRDRQDRLSELFLKPAADALLRAAQVTEESARYNLEDIGTFDMPLTALSFLQPRYQRRFRFSRGPLDTKVGPDAWLVQFHEWSIPTVLRRGPMHRDIASRGRLWIEESTGRVAQTELLIGDGQFPTQIVTTFRFDRDSQINVPSEMHEHIGGRTHLTGKATYGRFRRFDVHTDERFP